MKNVQISDLIEMGGCSSAFGIKGEFLFHLINKIDSSLNAGMSIYLFPKSDLSSLNPAGELYKIKKIKFGNKVVATLIGVDNRNIVEAMVPFIFKIARGQFLPLDQDENYISDLVGVMVYLSGGDELVGEVIDTYSNGPQTVVVIKGKQENFEIPFVLNFFPIVDVENNRMEVILPDMI